MRLKLYRKMKCSQKAKRNINQAFQGLIQNELNHHLDLEILSPERLYSITKTQKQSQNTKSTSSKIRMHKKTYYTQCRKQDKT